jgi:zinc protease
MIRRTLILGSLTLSIMAQNTDRTKLPETPAVPAFKLPPVQETTLPNGLTVVLANDSRFPMMDVRMGFQAGSKFDPEKLLGLSEIAGDLLKEGTTTRSSREFAEELASIGGSLNASSSADFLLISGNALSEHTAKLLDLLADMVRNAAFPEDEVGLRKANRKQELLAQRAQADVLADEKLREVIFGNHPYARMLPTPESIEQISRDDLVGFRDKFLVPNNAVLTLVGPMTDRKAVLQLIADKLGDWQRKRLPASPAAKFPEPKRSLILVDRPGSVQADIRVGRWAVDRTSPDYFPLLVANTVLGGGASSRVFMNIREEKGYAYDARTAVVPRKNGGLFTAITQVRNEVVEPAMEALLAEMRRMNSQPVPTKELDDVKNYLSGIFLIALETPAALATQLNSIRLNGLPDDYLEKYVPRVRAVGPTRVQAVSAKYIDPANLSIIVVGDAAKIGKQLEKFGKPTVEKAN